MKNQESQEAIISRINQYGPILHFMPLSAMYSSKNPHPPLIFILKHCQEAICEESGRPRSHNFKNGSIWSVSPFHAIFGQVFFEKALIHHRFSSSHMAKKPFVENQEGQEVIISRMDQYCPILRFVPLSAKYSSKKP